MRVLFNRWRRRWVGWLLHRRVFGEASQGVGLPFTRIAPSTCIDGEAGLRLGNHVYIGPFNLLEAHGGLVIEDGVQITSHCALVTHSSHRAVRLMGAAYADVAAQAPLQTPAGEVQRPGWISGSIRIGAYSFIGPHSVIEANTSLGRGSVVCAGSVVRGQFPPFAVLRGNPAVWVGDTREADAGLLRDYPQAAALYRAWADPAPTPRVYALVGDGNSPHLLKWVQALEPALARAAEADGGPPWHVAVVSSRGCLPELAQRIPPERRLELGTQPKQGGGNGALLRHLPKVVAWLKALRPEVVHSHYLTSHGTLAWLACRWWGVPGQLISSAWGSDVLVTPQRSAWARSLTRAVLRGSDHATADSEHMAQHMRRWGAPSVQVFPFGLMAMPQQGSQVRMPWLFFSNRALEPLYRIDRVLALFGAVVAHRPEARLVIANEGSQAQVLQAQVAMQPWADKVQFVGYLRPEVQATWYARAQWLCSLPDSDSVAVSVLEAMAHGCIPLLSDLPANRELVPDLQAGWCLGPTAEADPLEMLNALLKQAPAIAQRNRRWVEHHALFPEAVQRFLHRVGVGTAP